MSVLGSMIRPGLTEISSVVIGTSSITHPDDQQVVGAGQEPDLVFADAEEMSLPLDETLTLTPIVEEASPTPALDVLFSENFSDEPISTPDPQVSSIKALGLSAFDHAGEGVAMMSPAEPIDLLRDRVSPFHDTAAVSDEGAASLILPVADALQVTHPIKVLIPQKAPFDSAERSYAKHIAALERQSKEYSKLLKKAARSPGKRKRYGVGESTESVAPWWLKSVSPGASSEPRAAATDSEGDTVEADAEYSSERVTLERRLDAPWGRIFGLSLVPKRPRDTDKRGGVPPSAGRGIQRKAREEREPVGFAAFRAKQQERARAASREEPTRENEDRRSKEKRSPRKQEPTPAPKQHHQRVRQRSPAEEPSAFWVLGLLREKALSPLLVTNSSRTLWDSFIPLASPRTICLQKSPRFCILVTI